MRAKEAITAEISAAERRRLPFEREKVSGERELGWWSIGGGGEPSFWPFLRSFVCCTEFWKVGEVEEEDEDEDEGEDEGEDEEKLRERRN